MREGRRRIKVRIDGIRERTTIQTTRGCHPRGAAGDWHVDVKLKNYGMTCPFRFRTVTVTVLVDACATLILTVRTRNLYWMIVH
jgi:hypothetical protein